MTPLSFWGTFLDIVLYYPSSKRQIGQESCRGHKYLF